MRNKFLSIVLMLVLFMGLLHYGGDSKVHAAELPNVVKNTRITDTEENPLTGLLEIDLADKNTVVTNLAVGRSYLQEQNPNNHHTRILHFHRFS